MSYFNVDVYSHHFCLTRVSPRGREVIESFAKQYVQYGLVKMGRRFVRAPVKVFGARLRDHSEYRFHVEQFESFISHLNTCEVLPHTYQVTKHQAKPGAFVDFQVVPELKPRDYQIPVIEYIVSPEPTKRKLVELQTGLGKSLISSFAGAIIKQRTALIFKPQFIEKWRDDLIRSFGIALKDIYIVQGSDSLMRLIAEALAGEITYKAIIISSRTLQNWYSLYEKNGSNILLQGYGCLPQDLFPVLGIGYRIMDEVHLDFHLNFKVDLYTHVETSVSLSATLISDNSFLTRMYELVYPRGTRYKGIAFKKFVNTYSYIYQFNRPDLIKIMEYGSTNYSHHAFERSIMKNKKILENYLNMINDCIKSFFLDRDYQKGDKLLLYAASIDLCTLITEDLKKRYPHIDVRRYVEDDPYENLMDAEIMISTLLSAGTGHDIARLTTVILTTSILSSQSNIQGFGRLRDIPGRKLKFIYFVCSDIPKHIQYHERKKELMESRALNYDSCNYYRNI